MIQASLNDTKRIEGISPLFAKAFEYIKNTDFSKMEDGRHDIEVMICTSTSKHLMVKTPKCFY